MVIMYKGITTSQRERWKKDSKKRNHRRKKAGKEKWRCPYCKGLNARFVSKKKDDKKMFCCDCGSPFSVLAVVALEKTTKEEKKKYHERVTKAKTRRKRKFLGKRAAQMRNRPTLAESVFMKKLDEWKFKYRFQWVYDTGLFAGIVDFYLYDYKLLIEVDGGYHTTEEQRLKDAEKDFVCDKLLKKRMVRLTNEEAMAIDSESMLALLD